MSKLRYEHGLIQSFSIQSCTDPAKEMLIYLRTSPGYKLSDDVPTKVIKTDSPKYLQTCSQGLHT